MPELPAFPLGADAGVEQLQRHLISTLDPLPARPVALDELVGCVLAQDVTAGVDLPGFDNSAMDGYAVHAADLASLPCTLEVIGEIGAGASSVATLPPGVVAKIMTGAPVPAGADAVVPYEWTDRGADRVRIDRAPEVGAHIRRAGEDVAVGAQVLAAGQVLAPRHVAVLAAQGLREVAAIPAPRVLVVSTGAELREPGEELAADQIYDSNSPMLAALARRLGARVERIGQVGDTPETFLACVREAATRADLVVTTGGVSQGDFDVVKAALAPTGTVWFGTVAMQPGRPQGCGTVADAEGREVPIVTLPGNPVSSYVSFEAFVTPALRRLAGREPYLRPTRRLRLAEGLASREGKRQYLRGRIDPATGEVRPMAGHGSHLIGDLAYADALVVVGEDVTALDRGDAVDVIVLDEEF